MKATDESALLERIGRVRELPWIIRRRLRRVPDITEAAYCDWIPEFDRLMSPSNLENQWQHFLSQLKDSLVNRIQVCSDTLERLPAEKDVQLEHLEEIRRQVRVLMDDVLSSTLDPKFRIFLLKHRDIIEQALNDYGLVGIEPMAESANTVIGAILTDPHTRDAMSKSGFWPQIWDLLSKIAIIVTLSSLVLSVSPCPHQLMDISSNDPAVQQPSAPDPG